MPTFNSKVFEFCWRGSIPGGGALIALATYFPLTVWYFLSATAMSKRDIYYQLMASSYWLSAIVHVIISESLEVPRPNPWCNNDGWGTLGWEAQLAWHYIVMLAITRIANYVRTGHITIQTVLLDVARAAGVGIVIPFWLAYNGNYTAWQTIAGALTGTGVACFFALAFYLFFMDRLAFLTAGGPILNRWGFSEGDDWEAPQSGALTRAVDIAAEFLLAHPKYVKQNRKMDPRSASLLR